MSKRPDMIGPLNPMWGKKNPQLSESNRKRIGPLHPSFGKRGPLSPNFGKKCPWVGESNKRRIGPLHPMFGKKRPDMAARLGPLHPMFGKRSANWKGGRLLRKDGYILLFRPDHPYADRDGYVLEHRLILEKEFGRILLPTEIVHHIDLDKQNNDPSNLKMFDNLGDHLAYHRRLRQYFD